jgi:hypothetical protein
MRNEIIMNTAAIEAHKRIMERAKRMASNMKKEGSAPLTASDLISLKENGRKR